MSLVLDLIVVAVLALFLWRGASKGLVASLCGLLAFVVAFAGAGLAARTLSPMVADAIEPHFASAIQEQLEAAVPDTGTALPEGEDGDLPAILEALRGLGLYESLIDAVDQAVGQGVTQAAAGAAAAVASSIAQSVAYRVIFTVAFALLLAAWSMVSRTLNLMTRLPVLHFLNKTGGAAIGLVEGVALVLLAVWLLEVLGHAIPEDAVRETHLLKLFLDVPGLLLRRGV